MKKEWLVTDVTAVRSPDKAERAILGVLVLAGRFFGKIQTAFVREGPLCIVRPPS